MENAESIWRELHAGERHVRGKHATIDLSGVRIIDGGILSMVLKIQQDLADRHVASTIRGASSEVSELLRLYTEDGEPGRPRALVQGFIVHVGAVCGHVLDEVTRALAFVGELVSAAVGVFRQPRTGNWRDVFPQMDRAGVDALPIVLLINFFVGVVTALQSVTQLKAYGANIFVAHIVALGMSRELAPLITAIVVLGRSGASYAAEIGTMKVSEEIDALRVMGLSPIRYLVVPRAIALVVVVPVLTLSSVIFGVIGGAITAELTLDVSYTAFLSEMQKAAHPWDVISGLLKSVAYALAIVLIACQQGFATSGGAAGVGRRTTSTVVSALFVLILLNTISTIIFQGMSE